MFKNSNFHILFNFVKESRIESLKLKFKILVVAFVEGGLLIDIKNRTL